MASSRKPRKGRRVGKRRAVALSGGVDSVVLLHRLKDEPGVRAVHVHHGLSANADAWAAFCRKLCKAWRVPLEVKKVKVRPAGKGLEAAARAARYAAFRELDADAVALAHNLDDQAETVLMNLLRGAGVSGARGMAASSRLGGKRLERPLLETSREEILAYARQHRLEWVEDESNADESLTRNFVRRRLAPLIEARFPAWKRSLARAAKHFSRKEAGADALLRAYLRDKGLGAPSEARLVEMLKQLTGEGARTLVEHDGAQLRVYRGKLMVERRRAPTAFRPVHWAGEARLALPALGGELRFRAVRGKGIAAAHRPLQVRLRSGGERLKPDARRPRRTLKNLFQEAGVPPWQRGRLPLLYRGDKLVWAPGLGVDAAFQAAGKAPGVLPEWRPRDAA
jgi:tRNA(Ile)-lysidine synthase